APSPVRGQAQAQGSGQSPMLYVVLGVGSLAVLLLIGLIAAVLMRGNGNEGKVAAAPAGGGRPADVAEVQPVEPLAIRATSAPAAAAASPASPVSAAATPGTPITPELDHDQIIRRLKDATVFVILKIDGKPVASGSGFVIDVVQGNTTIIATN